MNKIPLVDLSKQYKSIKKEIDQSIKKVVSKTDFIMGDEVKEFENKFSDFLGGCHVLGVSSGTDAIHLVLYALGIGKGDEVILPSHTFTATAEPISLLGATPVFVDINEKTYQIDPLKVAKAITKKTKAIIPVHIYGHPAPIFEIMDIARKYRIFVLEDTAQAHGATITKSSKAYKVGTIADASIFSFYPGKNLGAYGDAGAVVTKDDNFAQKIKLLRNHGRQEKYTHEVVGFGDRIDTLQASILSAKVNHLVNWNLKRRKIASWYNSDLQSISQVLCPFEEKNTQAVYHLYVIRTEKRDELKKYLKEKGIETGVHYPIPLHLQKAYSYLGYKEGDLPVTEKICREILSLPIFPELSRTEVRYITDTIKSYFA